MESISSGKAALEARFPQLTFLLQLLHESPWTSCEEGKNGRRGEALLYRKNALDEELAAAFLGLKLDEIEVLYLYGMALGHYALPLLEWLKEDPKRDLVFLEDDIEVLRLFLETEQAAQLLTHPQIHFRLNLEPSRWKAFLEERANEFPYEHAELIALESYQKKNPRHVKEMRLHLMRRTTVHHAIHMEESCYHILSQNVFANFQRIDSAFYANPMQFEGVPAVICGAGPSLKEEMEFLRTLEERALIFAGGSAITSLSHAGILPHFGVAIDPNFEEYHRFRASSAFEVPLLYTNRLHPAVFQTCNGPHGYIHAMTGGPLEKWWEEEVGIEPISLKKGFDLEALSVTTTCLELAATMKCDPIILVGVDLAFTNDEIYASGIVNESRVFLHERSDDMRAPERLLKRKDRFGKPVYTLVKWIMESQAISRFAKKNRQATFINSTSGGIGFPSLPYQKLKDLSFPPPFDLRGKVHQLIEKNRLQISADQPLQTLHASLTKGEEIVFQALAELERLRGQEGDPESGRMIFYQMELEELAAYSCLLEQPALTFQKTFNRLHRGPSSHAMKWHWLHAKWRSFQDLIDYYNREDIITVGDKPF